ncbi:MAG: L,D-transpeptidase family protein [Candidatus Omnitrophica bacterium]|nr:L,D-transpeptidase family protein [Candidatus Omnitrophota bacterium]
MGTLSQGQRAPLQNLPADNQQAILVQPRRGDASRAKVTLWKRSDQKWTRVGRALSATVGRNGIAAPGEKREGDGRTPAGVFDLKRAFGYATSEETGLEYRQATADDFWVDDAASPQYNQWVTGLPAAKSYETLRRADDLYRQAIVVEYNTAPVVRGAGSAIFIHIWRNHKTPTAGCVALSQPDIQKALLWLDATQQPVIILDHEPH